MSKYKPMFQGLTYQDYVDQNVLWVEPMTAKEEERDEIRDAMLEDENILAEEKLDGVRCTLHIGSQVSRAFSRRVSKKTGWYAENTDSLPLLRGIGMPKYNRTVLDGELVIPNEEFKEISSMMNCTWDKAVDRQEKIGHPVFRVFDIVYYRGVYVARMPLLERKNLIRKFMVDYFAKCRKAKEPTYIEELYYFTETIEVGICRDDKLVQSLQANNLLFSGTYPNLMKAIGQYDLCTLQRGVNVTLTKKQYFEYIVANGGEGIMLKDPLGKYYHKRGREYTKVKKFITKEVIVIGFTPPTKEYEGKELDKGGTWKYWVDSNDNKVEKVLTLAEARGLQPVTKHYYMNWIGNIIFGVVVTEEDKEAQQKTPKAKEFEYWRTICKDDGQLDLVCVGECTGLTEEMRADITKNQREWKGSVIEVLANEMFKDTGKLRHPRYLRARPDKNPSDCTWVDHLGGI